MKVIGKPEPLSGDLQGEYSHRINEKDRLVYHMENERLSTHIIHHPNSKQIQIPDGLAAMPMRTFIAEHAS